MAVRLSSSFFKATIDKFSKVYDDPIAFPILLSFLEKAAQSRPLLQEAKDVVGDDKKFSNFYQKTRNNLPPEMTEIIQKQEEKIREKLLPAIRAEMRGEMRTHDLEIELKVRKEYEARADKKEREQERFKRAVIGKMIQLEFETHKKVDAITKQHEAFVEESREQAKSDRKHRNIAYFISAVSLAVGVSGVAVGWPGVVDKLTGKKSQPKNNDSVIQARLASSGQCLPSDMKVEIKKDGTTVFPSSGTVCLDVPEDPAPMKKDEGTATAPFHVLQENGWTDPFSGKSMFDLLNDGQMVKLFKQDGSSICLHMPNPIPCIDAKTSPAVTQKQKEAAPHRGNGKKHVKRHYPKRCL